MASLRILSGERAGEVVELNSDALTLGRSQDNDLNATTDTRMSRHHARLRRQGPGWLVEDLESANGTFIERGGQPVRVTTPKPLVNGDVLVVGSLRAAVALDAVPAESLETMVLEAASDETIVSPPKRPAPQRAVVAPSPQAEPDSAGDFERTRVLSASAFTPVGQSAEELVPASAPGLRPARVGQTRRAGHRLLATLIVVLPALILALVALYFAGIK